MSMLERLGIQTYGLSRTTTPFEAWEGSPIQKWQISMRMLNIGELAEIAKLTNGIGAMEASYLSKIYLLAKSLETINGSPVATQEDVDTYNKDHDLSGLQKVDIFGYKVLFIRKWTEVIINRLVFEYDSLQDNYLERHLGRKLPDALKAATISGVDLGSVTSPAETEEKSDDDSTRESTTST